MPSGRTLTLLGTNPSVNLTGCAIGGVEQIDAVFFVRYEQSSVFRVRIPNQIASNRRRVVKQIFDFALFDRRNAFGFVCVGNGKNIVCAVALRILRFESAKMRRASKDTNRKQ